MPKIVFDYPKKIPPATWSGLYFTHGHKVVYLRMCVTVSNTKNNKSLKIAAICKRMLNHFRPGPAPYTRTRALDKRSRSWIDYVRILVLNARSSFKAGIID